LTGVPVIHTRSRSITEIREGDASPVMMSGADARRLKARPLLLTAIGRNSMRTKQLSRLTALTAIFPFSCSLLLAEGSRAEPSAPPGDRVPFSLMSKDNLRLNANIRRADLRACRGVHDTLHSIDQQGTLSHSRRLDG
jgi:hypothetical protein